MIKADLNSKTIWYLRWLFDENNSLGSHILNGDVS